MQSTDRVQQMAALEEQVLSLLSRFSENAGGNAQVAEALPSWKRVAEENLAALRVRMSTAWAAGADGQERSVLPVASAAAGASAEQVLQACSAAFNHMALAYAALHAVCHRFREGEGEGNTADMAEEHLRRYARAAQEISGLISDVVVSDLENSGLDCRCQCPSCGLGLCVCAPHGAITVHKAWREGSPEPPGPGIAVRAPRRGSAAERAGLARGDRVVAADGQELASDFDVPVLQTAVRSHGAGDAVRLDVVRQDGGHREVSLPRT